MDTPYTEVGGLRWGRSFWFAANSSWPLARLEASRERIEIRVLGILGKETLSLRREEVLAIGQKVGLFSTGVVITHASRPLPPFILFWTRNYGRLKAALQELGYAVSDEE
jgi:hypothetical protein